MKRGLKLHLGLAFRGSAGAEPAVAFDPFLAAFDRTPLNWIVTAGPALEKRGTGSDRLVAEIKARRSRLGDAVIPAGYSGAPHPLLAVEEVSRELEWSRSNPWGSGLTDVFRAQPDALVPAAADLSRRLVLELYERHGFRHIGVPLGPDVPAYRFQGSACENGPEIFQYFDFTGTDNADPARLARSFFPKDIERAFLLVTPDGSDSLSRLQALLDQLRKKVEIEFAALEFPAGQSQTSAKNAHVTCVKPAALADAPLLRGLRDKAARLRTKEGLKNHELRELLLLTAGIPAEAEKVRSSMTAKAVAREGTEYTANMPGEILLPGNGFDAYFSGGRLTDLKSGRESLLPSGAPRAWASLGGKELPLPFDRIFSFEKNDLRGLEAFVLFPGPEREHVFTLRYAFSGEVPWLLVAGERLRRPSTPLDRLSAVAPIEIPIGECSQDAPLEVRRLYADGSLARTVFTGAEGATVLAGTVFSVTRGSRRLVFGYVPHKTEPVSLLEVRIVREKKRAVACINPFGVYRRESICGMFETGETRSFYIGLRNEEPDKPPFFPASVTKSIPGHALYRMP